MKPSLLTLATSMRVVALIGALAAVASAASTSLEAFAASLAPAPYAAWAHHHWVWLSSPESNQANVSAYVAEYAAHNITVGAVDIDSLWSTGVNNFIVDKTKFPDMKQLVDSLHAKSIKVILWATSMIDTDSSNYAAAVSNGYFIRDGLNQSSPDPLHWWHGDGVLLDYSNEEAAAWWNQQLDNVLVDVGVDGFKTDGTDPFIMEYVTPFSHGGPITYRQYADDYYGSFFNYSRAKNNEALIMARPVDSYPIIGDVSVYLNFAPRYAVFSGWVGDQDPTFDGLRDALGNMIHSAWLNYVGFGSDIGGYRTGKGPLGRTGELLLRWASVGAFCSLMENGGDKEHRPWKFDTGGSSFHEDAYRALVAAHYELEQYLLTTGAQAWESNSSIMRPVLPVPDDPLGGIAVNNLTDYDYLLGKDYYISPVLEAGATSQAVSFPPSTAGWFSVFNRTATYPGSLNTTVPAPLGQIPAFGRRGALIPLHVSTPLLGNGDEASSGAVTLLVHGPVCSEAGTTVTTELRVPQGSSDDDSTPSASVAALTCKKAAGGRASVSLEVTPLGRDVVLLLRGVSLPADAEASLSAPCTVRRDVSHPVLGPSAIAHKPAPQPLPSLRGGVGATQSCEATLTSAVVNAGGFAVASGEAGVGEVLLRRLPADEGLTVTLSGLVLEQ